MSVYLVTYVSILIFIAAILARFVRITSTPMHLRWEIYPVAHEPGDKPSYGGSYLEEPDWWEKPRETSFFNMMKVQIPEMLFLTAVRENNPTLWYRSFPFHFGLYMLAGAIVLMVIGLLPGFAFVSKIAAVVCIIAIFLGLFGTVGLLNGRLKREEYIGYNSPADIFNLVLFLFAFGIAFIGMLIDPSFGNVQIFLKNLLTFNIGGGGLHPFIAFEIIVYSILLAYIPLTHMSHFFVKYFTYHDIRWNDEPNIRGGKYEKKIAELLAYRVTWAAPHIRGEGKKTWLDVAMEDIKDEKK